MKRKDLLSKNENFGKEKKFKKNTERKSQKEELEYQKIEASEKLPINEDNKDDAFSELIKSLKSNKQIVKKLLCSELNQMDEVKDLKNSYLTEINETDDEDDKTNDLNCDEQTSDEEVGSKQLCNSSLRYNDPFKLHFENQLMEEQVANQCYTVVDIKFTENYSCKSYYGTFNNILQQENLLQQACVKEKLIEEWKVFNKTKANKRGCFTELQKQLFTYMGSYKDILFTDRSLSNGEEVRRLYCLHAVNHVLKTRSQIVKNNAKMAASEKLSEKQNMDVDFRDQGLTRPKVLMLVPYKDSCLKIINNITKLALGSRPKIQVMQKKRFVREFSKDLEEEESKAERPDDFKTMFQGNIDDDFKIGVAVAKNTIKLYAPFYHADIIVASPLGLRRIIATEREKQDFDFLSSIEILIMDQIDVFSMQNWEHVLHVFDYMNLTPRQSHDTDFSRVRMWCVDGLSKYYRQSLLFSSIQSAEIQCLFNKCFIIDYNGKIKVSLKDVNGTVEKVVSNIPQIYQRFECLKFSECADLRFNYFINKILPEFKKELYYSTAIFIPSYFDFVRIRNYFMKEELSFVQISEYSKSSNISRSRNLFFEKKKHFILLTERFYFFYRYKVRGIKHVIFYDLPQYPNFYAELINFMESTSDNLVSSSSCNIIYSKFDGYKLEAVVGTTRCKQMITLQKDIHMIVSGA